MPNDKLQQAASKFNQTIQGVYPELVIKNPESKEDWDRTIETLKNKGINTAKVESIYGLFENSVEPSKPEPITPKNMVEPDLSTEEGKKQYYDTKGAGTRLVEGVDAGFNQFTGGVRVATGNILKEVTGEAPLERVSRAIDLGRIPQGKTIPEYEALLAQREKEFDNLEKRRAEKYKFIRKENPFTGNPTINTGEVAIPSPAWTETDAEIQRQADDWDKRAGYDEKRYEIDNLRSYIALAKKEGVSGATAKAKEAAKTKSWNDEVIAQGVKDIKVDAPKGTGLVYNVGNFLPQVAPIVASAAAAPFTGGTSLWWIPAAASGTSMVALSYSSAGQFMHEYDQYTSQNGIEPDQGMKFGGAAAYAAFEIIGEKLALDAAVKKMTSQYIKKSVVAGVPNKAMDLLQTYLEKNPTMAKKFVSAAADYADNGFSEATSEVFTSLGQDFTYNISRDEEFKKGFKEVIYDAWQSAQGGFMMAGVTSPMIRASQQYLKNKGIRKNGITIVEDKVSGTPYQFLEANDDGSVLVTDKLGAEKKIPAENIGRVQKYDAQTYQDLVIQHKEGKQITILNPGDVIAESNEEQVSSNFGKFADQSGNLTIGSDDQGNQYFVTDIDDKTYGAVNAATGEKITIAKTSISLAGSESLGIIAANSISESVYKSGYLYGGNGKAVSIQEAIADAVSKGQTVESMAQLANEHMQLAAKSIQANDMNGATENTIKANFYTNLAKSLADATPKTEVVAGGTTIFNGKQHNVVSINNGIAELEEITEDGLGKSFDVPIQEIQAQSAVVNPTVPEVEKPSQEPVLPEDVKPDNQVVEQVKEPVPTEPKTYDIEVGKETVKAVQQDNGTFLLDKVYSKSEIEKASKLVETLNKDYEDNGLTFEITPLPKQDPANPFEKPTFAIVAKPIVAKEEQAIPEITAEIPVSAKTEQAIPENAAKEVQSTKADIERLTNRTIPEQQKRLVDAQEIVSSGKTFSEALYNLMDKSRDARNRANERLKKEAKEKGVTPLDIQEGVDNYEETKEAKRYNYLISLINDVYAAGGSEDFNNSTQEAIDFEQALLDKANKRLATLQSKADSNPAQEGDIKQQYPARVILVKESVSDGDNKLLEGEEADYQNKMIERTIASGIKKGLEPAVIFQMLSVNGHVFMMGAESYTMNNYIKNRINGSEVRSFQEFKSDTWKEAPPVAQENVKTEVEPAAKETIPPIEELAKEVPKVDDVKPTKLNDVIKHLDVIAEGEQVDKNPTEAQKEAGNYKKGHTTVQGFEVTIENPEGSKRSGTDGGGNRWETTMKNAYGYFKRTKGKDGDQVDFFLGNNPETGRIFVVDQMDTKTGAFDEHKVMLGFNSEQEAKDAYQSNYQQGWDGLGAITEMGRDEFKKWLKDGDRTKVPASVNLQKPTIVPADPEVSHNNLVKQVKNYNGLTKYQRGTKANRRLFKTLSTLATNLGYDITTNTDGSVNVTKGGSKIRTITQKKTKEEINAHKLLTEYPQEFQDFANFIMGVDNLGYIDVDMDKKAVSQGIKNIKEGKKTVAANALLDELSAIYNLGEIHLSNNGEGTRVSLQEFRNLYASEEKGAVEEQQANELFEPTEEGEFVEDYNQTLLNAIADNSITKENVESFDWLLGEAMLNDIKTILYETEQGNNSSPSTGSEAGSAITGEKSDNAADRGDAGAKENRDVEEPRNDQAAGNQDGRDAANPEQVAEEGLTELQKSEIEAKTGELSRKIEAKRAELVAEKGKLQSKKNELEGKKTTQTALFGEEKPQFAGQLFDIPADFSQGNITRALKDLKSGITIKEKELTELVTKRDEIVKDIVDNATAQQELKLAAEPEKKESAYQIPSSFTSQTISEFSNELDKGNIDVETFKKAFDVFMSSKNAIIEELTGKTKAELLSGMNAMGKYRYKNEKKDAIVRAIYDSNLMTFSFGTLSWSHGESVEDVIRRKVEKTTQEDIDKNVEEYNKRVKEYKARAAEYKKALTNPETIAEFGIFIAKNGKDALSVEQKAAYDNLITDKVLDKRSAEAEKKAEVSKVEIGDTGMNLIETKHTKTGEPIFVVTLSNRVDSDTYKDLNAKAKKLGGYYSSFRGNGAIPGFTFKDKAQAENFMALKEGDVSTSSEEVKAEETKFKADKLRDAAQKMIEKADESLGRERLTNTYKRANEASRADANANEEKRIAETMINIADAIDAGNVKLLNGVKAKTHIELLEMMVRTSKNQEIAAKYPNDRIKHKDDPATLETIEYLRFGYYPSIYGRAIVDLANKASRKSGFKQVAARWEKKLGSLSEYENYQVTSDREIDELTEMFNALPEKEKSYSQVGNSLANHKRLKAMGVENDAMLRAVLREYIQYRGKAKEADKVKELERAIVGRNVGFDFFPTPSSVAELMVDEAGITKGMDVLEPSAGNGNIADAVKNADVIPDVIELSSELSKILEAKGYPVVGSDFMSYNEKQYDRIVMNPPFSNGADGDHVMHAYELLKPGGRIVAIVGEGTFIRSDKKATNFREWLDQVNGSEERLPQGTFSDKKLLNTTQANARMVVIDKPESVEDPNPIKYRFVGELLNSSTKSERHHQQVSKAVNDLQEKAPNALPLRVVRNNKELSEAIKDLSKIEQEGIQEAINKGSTIFGFKSSKAVFIVSESMADENEAIHTWIHEQGGHLGIELLIPNEDKRNAFFEAAYESVGEEQFKKLLDEIDPTGEIYATYKKASKAEKGSEYLAFLAEKILNREQMTPDQYKFWSVIRQKILELINRVLTSLDKRATFTDRELALIVKAGASKLYEDKGRFETGNNTEQQEGANASNGSALRGDRGGILVVPEIQNTVSSPNLQAIHAERAYREFDPIATHKVAHDALLRSVPNSKLERLSFGHGTNVEFSNFDIKYAGTGTGEKIHGYGLYLSITANDPAVAVTYANKVAFTSAEVRKYAEGISEKYGHLAFKAFEKATYDTKRGKDLLTSLKDRYAETGKPYIKSVIDHVESNPIPFSKIVYFGQMEKPDGTPFHFIEWDTEFVYKDQWDAITNGLNREGHSVDEWLERLGEEALLDDGQLNGKQVYRSLAKLLAEKSDDSNGSPKNASEFLYRAGFDGTIYADKEIADGKERYNVCSFSDKPIHITETVKFRKKDKNPAEMSRLDVQIRRFADRMIAQKNIEKEILKRGGRITDASNVSMQENLSSSIASEAMKKFNREMVKPYVETIVSVMKEGNLTQEDIEKYLIAKHTPERNKTFRDLGKEGDTFSGMDEKEALERVKDVEGKVSGELISKLWEQTNAITKFALDYDLASGRISKETHDRYTGPDNDWKHYVPLKGWEAETLDDADYVDTGSGSFTPTLKKAKGRTSASDTPIHYMISAAYSSIAAGEKNKVKAAAVRLATNNPDMTDIFHLKKVWMVKSGLKDENGKDIYLETTEKPSPEQFNQGLVKTKIDTRHEVGKPRDKSKQEEVTAYIKGEKYTVIYEPKYVAAANAINKVTGEKTAKANDVIQGTIGIFTRWLSANFTSKSPDFILPNFVRDVSFGFMSESLKEGKGLKFLENTRKGMATIHRAYANKLDPKNPIDVHYQNWLKNGGPTGFVHLGSLESIKSNIDLEVKRLMKDNSLWDKTTQNRLFKKLGAMMDYAAIMSENASRFGVYLTSIEQGKSEAKAAHDGKEATVNFNTKGEWSGIIGGFFTFFNASVQGGKTFAKLGYENKGKMAIAGASFMALGYLVAAMNRFMDDDEEYDKENPYIRENNLIFKSGKNHVMIPLPHGFRMFYALGVIINDLEHGKETVSGATRRGMSSVVSSFSPIDPVGLVDKKGSLSLRPIIPTTMIPIYDIAKNEDFAGRKIHNEPFMLSKENVLADRGLGLKNVNPFLQQASDILFELGGGELDTGLKTKIADGKESRIKGIYDLNPSDVEHIISFYTGGRGQFFNNVIKMGNSIVDQSKEYAKDKDLKKAVDGLDINSMPILRRFYKEPWAGSNYKEFIKIRDEVEAYKATLTEYEKMMVNNVPRYIGAMTAMDLQQKAIIYESFNKSIKELNAQADNLMEYSDPSAIIEQKDQLVNQMIEQVKNIKK